MRNGKIYFLTALAFTPFVAFTCFTFLTCFLAVTAVFDFTGTDLLVAVVPANTVSEDKDNEAARIAHKIFFFIIRFPSFE